MTPKITQALWRKKKMVKNLLRIYLEFSTLLLLMGNTQLNFNDKKSYVVKDRDLDQRRGKKKKKKHFSKKEASGSFPVLQTWIVCEKTG